jgi:hypothetical protein
MYAKKGGKRMYFGLNPPSTHTGAFSSLLPRHRRAYLDPLASEMRDLLLALQ